MPYMARKRLFPIAVAQKKNGSKNGVILRLRAFLYLCTQLHNYAETATNTRSPPSI